MVTLAAIAITALLAPVIAPIDLGASDLTQRLKMPKFKDPTSPYLFGTDNLGRDVAIRLLYAKDPIMISFTGMIIATVTELHWGFFPDWAEKMDRRGIVFLYRCTFIYTNHIYRYYFCLYSGGKAGYDQFSLWQSQDGLPIAVW